MIREGYVQPFSRLFLALILAGFYLSQAVAPPVLATPGSGVIRVAPSGADEPGCGSADSPCQTIQYAVNGALPNDEIRVAAGVYRYSAANDVCSSTLGATAVVCFVNSEVILKGGYSTSDWSTPDLNANPTIIDGEDAYRGVFVVSTGPVASLQMENFIIQNGVAGGIPSRSGDDAVFGYGGGMFVDLGSEPDPVNKIVLRNLIFRDNKALGEDTSQTSGGSGVGGGLALRSVSSAALESLTFENNLARGGCGALRGGYGIGGGLHTLRSVVTFSHITLIDNKAQGGSCSVSGRDGGAQADAQGGGAATHGYSLVFQDVTATGNQAIGGDANEYGGRAFGGALYVEHGSLTVLDSDLRNNTAVGGRGTSGGLAGGGAVDAHNSDFFLERTHVIGNLAKGGDGTVNSGSPGGGGVYVARLAADAGNRVAVIKNSVLANNSVEFGTGNTTVGGGAGAAWLQGAEVTISHTTFAQNRIVGSPLQGQALLLLDVGAPTPSSVWVGYSIFAAHTNGVATGVVHAQGGNLITLQRSLWAGNDRKLSGEGSMDDRDPLDVSSAGFVAPGAPEYDYHLREVSPAIDRATGSSESVDVDSEPRPILEGRDIGADEYSPPALEVAPPRSDRGTLYVSWTANLGQLAELGYFDVVVSCASGAAPPNEGDCDQPINTGLQTELTLTGLTDGQVYTLVVEARDVTGGLIAAADPVYGVPGLVHKVFLPLVSR